MGVKKDEDDLVDAGSEYSFPASDPPSYRAARRPGRRPSRKIPAATIRSPRGSSIGRPHASSIPAREALDRGLTRRLRGVPG